MLVVKKEFVYRQFKELLPIICKKVSNAQQAQANTSKKRISEWPTNKEEMFNLIHFREMQIKPQ